MRVVLQDFRYGRIMRPGGDHYIGGSLGIYGEYSEGEIDCYRQCVKPGDTVLDIGANIGACTVPLAQMVGPEGRVYAFEPQRVMYQMCCGNVVLNNLMNVYVKNQGIGAERSKIKIEDAYIMGGSGSTYNVGNFALSEKPGDYEVEIIPVDELNLSRCDFIKCDTEGMGLDMLQGAEQTIRKFSPVLYIEREEGEQGEKILDFLKELNYKVYLQRVPVFNYANCFGEATEVVVCYRMDTKIAMAGEVNDNWLCLPEGSKVKMKGFKPVK